MSRIAPAIALCSLIASADAPASPADEVAGLIGADTAPAGVVFEVVSGDETELDRVLPEIRELARRLRERFPELPLAVLTHGSEQFSLLGENTARYGKLHELASAFTENDRIPVQVCGNHASWRGKGDADFPDYVEVVSSAASKLTEYREAGYVIIGM
jgi:intracellular sulfur oxidation DsrE/DsrF family protein